jgi:hypothetical protein
MCGQASVVMKRGSACKGLPWRSPKGGFAKHRKGCAPAAKKVQTPENLLRPTSDAPTPLYRRAANDNGFAVLV